MRVSSSSGVRSRYLAREEPDVGAFLDRDQVHVFELAGMRVGAHFLDDLREHLPQRLARFGAQLVHSQRSDEDAFELVPPQGDVIGERRQILGGQRQLELPRDGQQQRLALGGGFRREQRDVDVEPALPLEVDLDQVRARRREHPEDAAAVAGLGHLLGQHRVDAAGQAAVAVAAFAAARRLVGLVHEHDHLAERTQDGEDLLQVRLGRADPAVAEVLEDHAGDAELARPALHQERLAGADAAGKSGNPSAARAGRPASAARHPRAATP